MSHFKDMLKDTESVFRDTVALDYDFIPKPVRHRESEQSAIANSIKPLFSKRNGKNLLVHGAPGVGKTVAVRQLFEELEDETDEVIPIYINCWQKTTSYKIVVEICDQIGYRFVQNKKTEELFKIVKENLNKKSAVFCFDEIDKAEDLDFLYNLLEDLYRKTIVLITNYKDWVLELDERIKSRLLPEMLEFNQYNAAETKDILSHRLKFAFASNVWDDKAFEIIAAKTFELGDIRTGLHLLKEAGNAAEDKAARKITVEHVAIAIDKLNEFLTKKTVDLEDEEQFMLKIIKINSGTKIGELFKIYSNEGGKSSYKTFQRKIAKLSENKFISTKKMTGGPDGTTTIVNYSGMKKLTEF
ncbi:AAA family ATPase [Candidatus Woesearchaeota archaeon]|nr:AAA family ATPase [Candidatus Woesearchaeota archaeon]